MPRRLSPEPRPYFHANPWDPEASKSLNFEMKEFSWVKEWERSMHNMNNWDSMNPWSRSTFLPISSLKKHYQHRVYKLKPQTRLIHLSVDSRCPLSIVPLFISAKPYKPLLCHCYSSKREYWQLPQVSGRLKEWRHWLGIFKMVTMLAVLWALCLPLPAPLTGQGGWHLLGNSGFPVLCRELGVNSGKLPLADREQIEGYWRSA